MNITDPIADLLTRIRNGQQAKHDVITIPASKLKIGVTHLLKQEGYVRAYRCIRDDKQGLIKIALKYDDHGKGVITALNRRSRPGRRYYVKADDVPFTKNGFGIGILSTSKGLMTDRQARTDHVGGEYLCSVY